MTTETVRAGAPDVLSGLDPEQRTAVLADTGAVCILAGAGTGKTRTITHRIAHLVRSGQLAAPHVLAVTFTARAAGEMRTRLRDLGVGGVQARTFHAAALRQLRYFAPRVLGGPLPDLVDNKLRLVGQAATRCRINPDRTTVRDLASEIEWAKCTLVTPETYPAAAAKARRNPPLEATQVAAVLAAYEEVKTKQGVLDFEDMLLVTAFAIEEHRDVAEQIRAQYRHFLVDEYQDVNPLQQRLLDAWLGGRDDLCVVGDANQTIYSFTGARPDYLLQFPSRYPGATVVRLERDYRSTPQVVELANRVIAQSRGRLATARLSLVGQRAPGPKPVFKEHSDEPAEAASVAAACRSLIKAGTPASEIAVLFRTNAQSESYESALTDLGVPYILRGGERFFERREVREALMLLRGAARAAADDRPEGLVQSVRAVLSSTGWSAAEPPPGGAARERWESLAALVGLAEELAGALPTAGLTELVAELEQRAAAQHAPTVHGVTLASLHAAKGLEWDAVFLVGLADGTVPIQHANTDEEVEEERRLLYVGITRARKHLTLSWALARAADARRVRRPSRFLNGLDPRRPTAVVAELPLEPRKPRAKSAPARCRVCGKMLSEAVERKLGRCENCPSDVDEALFERLRTWRGEAAAEDGVPAYVVFTDATLTAIAEVRPTSVQALSSISGVGPHKLDRYGEAVLALIGNRSVTES